MVTKRQTSDGEYPIEDISVAVYKHRLGPDSVRRMLRDDAESDPDDNGKKLKRRAEQYESLTRTYIKVLSEMKLLKEVK